MASTAFLQQAYLAYFGRPADPSGLAYYSEKTEAQVKAAFSASPESQAFFGSLEINAQINTIYQNLFNRDAEPAGLAYWSKEIGAGRLSLADAAMGILAGAQNADKTAVANKLAASAAFTAALDTTAEILGYAGAASIAPARAYLQAVDSSAASLTAATAGVDASIAGVVAAGAVSQGQTFVLTTGVDGGAAFTGTAKNDIFNAALVNSVNSLNSLDSLTGGAGSDTLNVELASSVTPAGIAGIEIINTTFSAGGLALNLVNAPDVTTVTSRSSANSGTVSNIAAGASVGITDQAVGATFAYKTTEGTQTVGLALNNVTSNAAITISGIETINVTSGTSANSMALAADSVTTLNVSGSANLTLSNVASGSASLTKLDASALTGSLDMGAAGPAGLVTINGGSGNDSLYGTSSVNNNLNAGAGNDTIVMAGNLTSADTINGGNGTDVLSMTAGGAADSVFTNVSSVETLTLSTGGTITLGAKAQAAGIVTINGSTVADTISATAYTVGITYTEGADSSADSIALGSGNDVFVFGGTLQLSGNDTLDGNGGTDVIRLDNSAGAVSAIVDLDLVTDIEQIVVFDADGTTNGVAGTAQNIDLTLAAVTGTSGDVGISTLTIDASVITDASDALIMTNNMATAGLTLSITGGAGNDVLAGASGADTISGGAGADSIDGNSGNDVLSGDAGNDAITAGAGNDSVSGGVGNDTIVMAGNLTSADTINGGDGTDVLSMTAGGAADSVFTNVSNVETLTLSTGGTITLGAKAQAAGIVTINGSTVADTISATAYTVGITYTEGADSSADSIALGSGNDVFVFGGTLQLSGNDTLDGNGGTDVIRLDNSAGTVSAIVDFDLVTDIEQIVVFDADGTTNGVTGTAQNIDLTLAAVTSTAGAVGVSSIVIDASVITDASDALIMTNSMATAGLTLSITGGAGNDVLAGASGADTISGGAGNDSIDGNSGNDVLSGNAGNDTITGGVGNDTITGGTGNDSLNGQTGNDVISGDAGNDNITAGTGNDSLSGGDGNDTFVLADNLTLDDSIDGGLGSDILTVNGTIADSAFLFVSGVETITADGGSNNWTLGARAQNAGIVNINGSTTADVISATAYTVGIVYTEGAASSADSIALGAGNDVFVFSGTLQLSGNDTLDGNGGTDVIRLDNSSGSVSAIVDFDLVTDIEQIVVFDADGTTNGTTDTTQNITLTLNAVTSTSGVVGVSNIVIDASVITDASDALIMTNNMATAGFTMSITGGAGNDVLAGASGADTITGGAGADSIDGNSGNDVLSGDAGNDTITGAAGNDTISGGAGNDSLNGGSGMDSLTGGAGADTFNVSDASTTKFSYDVITDLTLADDDVVVFADTALTESFVSTGISLGGAATFTDYLNQAASLSDAVNSVISWFQFNGNTYLVQDCSSGAATFVDGTDIVVEITGLVTLSGATLSGQSLTV